jgi:hypothetical protein
LSIVFLCPKQAKVYKKQSPAFEVAKLLYRGFFVAKISFLRIKIAFREHTDSISIII